MLQPGTFALTLLLAMLTALGPLSMDMYLPVSYTHLDVYKRQVPTPTATAAAACGTAITGSAVAERAGRRIPREDRAPATGHVFVRFQRRKMATTPNFRQRVSPQ